MIHAHVEAEKNIRNVVESKEVKKVITILKEE